MRIHSMIAAVGIMLASSHMAKAVDLVNLLGSSDDGVNAVNNSNWIANSFTTTATEYMITDVVLRLSNPSSLATGDFQVAIYTATGAAGRPGTLVSTISTNSATSLASSASDFAISGLTTTLEASKKYFLVLKGLTLDNNISWSFANTATGIGATTSSFSSSTNSGTSWAATQLGMPDTYKVTATAAVPEPSTYALGALASGALVLAGRRKAAGLILSDPQS
ncbi:MAG: PEP-CTERM sorting domain-containing protein [Planctomycetota bacterium]